MKHIFVYNPAAGRNSKVAVEALQEKMKEYDGKLEYEFYYTKSQRDATAFIKERCAAEPDEQLRFYACGGDGTANEVLHGIIDQPNASMTVYPCGSGNKKPCLGGIGAKKQTKIQPAPLGGIKGFPHSSLPRTLAKSQANRPFLGSLPAPLHNNPIGRVHLVPKGKGVKRIGNLGCHFLL